MKLSFSTKNWPDYDFNKFVEEANELKFGAIELHDTDLAEGETNRIRSFLFNEGVEICAVNSEFNIADKTKLKEYITELPDLCKKAKLLNCDYVRVYAKSDEEDAKETVIDFLKEAIPIAEKEKATILIVTRDLFSDTEKLSEVLKAS